MADDACPIGDSWIWNQCLMDLGAVLCRPTDPACDRCPVAAMCSWSGSGAPDPATGSSGVSAPQGRFAGSDREARGRLMKALSSGPVVLDDVASIMQRDQVVVTRLVRDLVREGLCRTRVARPSVYLIETCDPDVSISRR